MPTGNLYGEVTDQSVAALPGVTITVMGSRVLQVQVTDAQGRFRFMDLPPGTYHVRAELEGFETSEYPNNIISVGRNTTIHMAMRSAIE